MPKPGVGLNKAIADHAVRDKGWDHADLLMLAYQTYAVVNKVLHEGKLPEAIIGIVEDETVPKMGDYKWGGDGLRLRYHFDLRHDLDQVEALIAVLACALHVQTEAYKKESLSTFKVTMSAYGITVDAKSGEVASVDTELLNGIAEKLGQKPPKTGVKPSKTAALLDEGGLLPPKKTSSLSTLSGWATT